MKKKIDDADPRETAKSEKKTKALKMPAIRALDYVYEDGVEVSYEYPELTAICPMTGVQDLYTVKINWVPAKKVPELRSLRFYFLAYRDVPVLNEHLACKIFDDFKKAVRPRRLRVELDVAVRGGIHTRVVKERPGFKK